MKSFNENNKYIDLESFVNIYNYLMKKYIVKNKNKDMYLIYSKINTIWIELYKFIKKKHLETNQD